MKHLSIFLPAIALALVLTLSGAAPGSVSNTSDKKTAAAAATVTSPAPYDIMYYWYSCPDDEYNDFADATDETFEWWVWLGGVSINQNPVGGTCIARGYQNNSYPHNYFPAIYLYAHYVY